MWPPLIALMCSAGPNTAAFLSQNDAGGAGQRPSAALPPGALVEDDLSDGELPRWPRSRQSGGGVVSWEQWRQAASKPALQRYTIHFTQILHANKPE